MLGLWRSPPNLIVLVSRSSTSQLRNRVSTKLLDDLVRRFRRLGPNAVVVVVVVVKPHEPVEPPEPVEYEMAVDTGDLKPPATTNVLPMTAHPG